MSSIAEQVQHIVAEHLGVAQALVTPEAAFTADLGISPKQTALLRRKIEQELDVALPKDEAKNLVTVGDLIRHVERDRG
ncbi:acyl carrier protein [Kitasatospora kifunensis]|uniref:Acyl carrier protein n=1 Tax=Kitasatospora kifunensis TaxID=58351 RepID=A0A7W7W017_KITKI|nr:acyl carrier protein [Kitasatospora kifunensis]MBB4928708.1 acyl carrier protein [Kitasatospora kifunensis]